MITVTGAVIQHWPALPLFIVLKTAADVGMHELERRIFRGVD